MPICQSETLLFTPGPLTTPTKVRAAMTRDWGSRDAGFVALTSELRQRLVSSVGADENYLAVPLQGSGTFAIEATIGSLLRQTDCLLVLSNGAYGKRMFDIATRSGKMAHLIHSSEHAPIDPEAVKDAIAAHPNVTHIGVVHCETTTGVLNPLSELVELAQTYGKKLIVDAMSSFGALPLCFSTRNPVAVIGSSNKCLEGAPGLSFVICRQEELAQMSGVSRSLSLDLFDQWKAFEATGQWRFTPPVQVVAALVEALRLLQDEGGPQTRLRRYAENMATLKSGMTRLGFQCRVQDEHQSPIIAAFHSSDAHPVDFRTLYDQLAARGFLIYPGKTADNSFRIGCIGALNKDHMLALVSAIKDIVQCNADVPSPAPA